MRTIANLRQLPNQSLKGYAYHSASLLSWFVLRSAAQAALVFLFSRILGAFGYGQLVAILAIASFFSPMAGLGLQGVLLRDGSRTPEALPNLIGDAALLWLLSSLVFSALAAAVAASVLPTGPSIAITAVIVSEVSSSSFVEMAARVQQAQQRIWQYGATFTGLVLLRLSVFAVYTLFSNIDLADWFWCYAITNLIYTAALYSKTRRKFHLHRPKTLNWSLVKDGTPFALSTTSMRLQAEFNKPVLARMEYALAGNFSAAQRITDIAALPLIAMQEALWPRLYAGKNYLRRVLSSAGLMVTLGLCFGIILTLVAPLLPLALGKDFEPASRTLRLIAWLPALQVLRNFANFHIAAQHKPHILSWAYILGALTSIVSTSILATQYGLAGAAAAAYITELAILIILLGLAFISSPQIS